MIVITNKGDYEFLPNTKTLRTSNHPVFQAQVEIHLAFKAWIGSPQSPQPLARFDRVKQSQIKIDEFRKEFIFYLQKYSPDVQAAVIKRAETTIQGFITEGAFNG